MEIEYNGVRLELASIERVSRQNVYTPDMTDLLYVRWNIGVTAVYGAGGRPVGISVKRPQPKTLDYVRGESDSDLATNPVRGANPPTLPESVDQEENVGPRTRGHDPIVSDVDIRHRLLTPRRKLFIWGYDRKLNEPVLFLESPRPDFSVDATNGPKPIALDVLETAGEGTGIGVYWQVQTDLPPCPDGSDRAVLGHRWEMSHTHDDDYYLSRIVKGTIVFNGAVLQAEGLNADWFRAQFFHPIPLGFRRHVDYVVQSPDGLAIDYQYTDTDATILFDAGDSMATRINIEEVWQYHAPWR